MSISTAMRSLLEPVRAVVASLYCLQPYFGSPARAFHNGTERHLQPNANDQVADHEFFIEVMADQISTVPSCLEMTYAVNGAAAWLLQSQAGGLCLQNSIRRPGYITVRTSAVEVKRGPS